MASWDNAALAPPPSARDYAAPLIDFTPLSRLGDRFFEGARNRTEYDAAQQLKQGLPRLPDGSIDWNGAIAQIAQSGNMEAVNTMTKAAGVNKSSDDIREFEYARKAGFTGSFEEWMQRKRGGAGEYGLTPIWGRDKEGNVVMMQPGKSGTAIQTQLPPGITLQGKNAEKIDAGTHWVLIDPLTRQTLGTIPKNIEDKKSAEQRGEAQGQAQVNLPSIITKTSYSLQLIDDMIKHPGRETATGVSGVLDPRNYVPGTDAKNFQIRARQVQGRTFLEAFESLRGGGAITEIEGQKAQEAIARLDRAQSDKEYLEALKELQGILRRGMTVARQKAAGKFSEEPAGLPPPPGQPAAPPAAPPAAAGAGKLPPGVTPDQARAEARKAITAGHDRNGVLQKLQSMGVDPAGL